MHASLQFTPDGGAGGASGAERDALLAGEASKDVFREAACYGPLVLQLLEGVLTFSGAQFRDNLDWLYPLLTGLISAGSVEIRQRVAAIFNSQVKDLLFPAPGK